LCALYVLASVRKSDSDANPRTYYPLAMLVGTMLHLFSVFVSRNFDYLI